MKKSLSASACRAARGNYTSRERQSTVRKSPNRHSGLSTNPGRSYIQADSNTVEAASVGTRGEYQRPTQDRDTVAMPSGENSKSRSRPISAHSKSNRTRHTTQSIRVVAETVPLLMSRTTRAHLTSTLYVPRHPPGPARSFCSIMPYGFLKFQRPLSLFGSNAVSDGVVTPTAVRTRLSLASDATFGMMR